MPNSEYAPISCSDVKCNFCGKVPAVIHYIISGFNACASCDPKWAERCKEDDVEIRHYEGTSVSATVRIPKSMIGNTIASKDAKLQGVEPGQGILPDLPGEPSHVAPLGLEGWKSAFKRGDVHRKAVDVAEGFLKWAEQYWGLKQLYEKRNEESLKNGGENAPWSYVRDTFKRKIEGMVEEAIEPKSFQGPPPIHIDSEHVTKARVPGETICVTDEMSREEISDRIKRALLRNGKREWDRMGRLEREELIAQQLQRHADEIRASRSATVKFEPFEHIDLVKEVPKVLPEILEMIPPEVARRYKVFPVKKNKDGELVVALCYPLDEAGEYVETCDALRYILKMNLEFVTADKEQVWNWINRYYGYHCEADGGAGFSVAVCDYCGKPCDSLNSVDLLLHICDECRQTMDRDMDPVKRGPYPSPQKAHLPFDEATKSQILESLAKSLDIPAENMKGEMFSTKGQPFPKKENHKLDTDKQVFFYEQEFYVLSNFSAFTLIWKGFRFDTSEAAYHWEKFPNVPEVRAKILKAKSAHEALEIARKHKDIQRPDWDDVKVGIMREILKAKAQQHEYVMRKLLETAGRELVEDSWRDDFWGWGPNKDGKNMLGKLWMEVRDETIRAMNENVRFESW